MFPAPRKKLTLGGEDRETAIHPSNTSDNLTFFHSSSDFARLLPEGDWKVGVASLTPSLTTPASASHATINQSYHELYPSLNEEIDENVFDSGPSTHVSSAISSSTLPWYPGLNNPYHAAQTNYCFEGSLPLTYTHPLRFQGMYSTALKEMF